MTMPVAKGGPVPAAEGGGRACVSGCTELYHGADANVAGGLVPKAPVLLLRTNTP